VQNADITLEDVRLPDDQRLVNARSFTDTANVLRITRGGVAWGADGLQMGAYETALAYSLEREQFGKPLAGFQLVQALISDMSVDADAARLLVWRCADLIERGEPFGVAASKAKLFASEAAVRAANNAIQVYGGAGYVDEHPAEKYLRDARVMTLYEGTSQIQKLLIGRAETGVNAFL
jgi:alkylation response protein AidB-like acyl-CoA dehydrogenase